MKLSAIFPRKSRKKLSKSPEISFFLAKSQKVRLFLKFSNDATELHKKRPYIQYPSPILIIRKSEESIIRILKKAPTAASAGKSSLAVV